MRKRGVWLSHPCIVSNGLKISSDCLLIQVTMSFQFLNPNNVTPLRNSWTATRSAAALNKRQVHKICNFRQISCYEKRYKIGSWLLWNVNRKSHVPDRSVSAPMTLSDLERQYISMITLASIGARCPAAMSRKC